MTEINLDTLEKVRRSYEENSIRVLDSARERGVRGYKSFDPSRQRSQQKEEQALNAMASDFLSMFATLKQNNIDAIDAWLSHHMRVALDLLNQLERVEESDREFYRIHILQLVQDIGRFWMGSEELFRVNPQIAKDYYTYYDAQPLAV